MNPATFDKPFFEVTLPLMLTIGVGIWAAISLPIIAVWMTLSRGLVRLEEPTSPFARR